MSCCTKRKYHYSDYLAQVPEGQLTEEGVPDLSPGQHRVADSSAVGCGKVRPSSRTVSFPSVEAECGHEFRTCCLVNARTVANQNVVRIPLGELLWRLLNRRVNSECVAVISE